MERSSLICFTAAALLFLPNRAEATGGAENLCDLFEQGQVGQALEVASRVLDVQEKSAQARPELSDKYADAALLHDYLGNYERAESLYLKALAIQEPAFGIQSWQTRLTLRNLFALYVNTGRAAKAEAILRRSPQLQEEIALPPGKVSSLAQTERGTNWMKARLALANGWVSYLHGDIDAALDLAKSAEEINRRIAAQPSLSDTLNLIGTTHYKRGEYSDALKIYEEALALSIAAAYEFGKARNWSSLGSTHYRQGNYRLALENYEKSLAARRRLGNKDEVARALNDLANVHQEMGAYERALALRQEALALWKSTGNEPGVADALNDIAWIFQSKGDYAKAISYVRQARDLHQKISDRWGAADDTDGIGLAHLKMTKYPEALEAFQDSLRQFTELGSIEERARVQSHLGEALHHLNRLPEAEAAFTAALDLYQKVFGAESPRIAETLRNLSLLAMDAGQKPRAIEFARRRMAVSETLLANVLSFTSEQQRLEFQQTTDPYSLLATLECGPELAQTLLRNKGIVLDSLLEDRLVAEASADPQQREKVSRLRTAKQRLMQLSLETPNDTSADALRKRDDVKIGLSREVEELESTLAREVAGLGRARRALTVSVPQLQAALEKDEALVEFVAYQHYLGENKFESRYGAAVITPGAEPRWVSLGPATEIDRKIRLFQKSARGELNESATASVLNALEKEVWAPLAKWFPNGSTKIIVSPDGALSFVSFATLIGSDNRFLGEKYSIRYVASGRDLLRQIKTSANQRTDVFANPDFGSPTTTPGPDRAASLALRAIEMRDLQTIALKPLPGTAREATALKTRAGDLARLFLGANASETELRRVNSPRVLHLATHGFFLPEIELAGRNAAGQNREIPKGKLLNPMHRSGFALAGAQTTLSAWSRGQIPPTENDGIVTAEEVGGLMLEGTDLVVLSACDTGAGEAKAGEGVMGLRRGFIQSGARNLLMTLWPISDETTVQIMTDFYDAAFQPNDAPQALANVQRDWLVKLRKEKGLLAAVRLAGPFIMSSQGKP